MRSGLSACALIILLFMHSVSAMAGLFGASKLTTKQILAASSSSRLTVAQATLLLDNDASFETKLEALRSAKPGETIRLTYFIYTDDQSSSLFSAELLEAARRGVKVRLLVDYLTNYIHLDLFSMLEKRSQGMIEVRYYGRPDPLIHRDALFLTRPCPTSSGAASADFCSKTKWAAIHAEIARVDLSTYSDFFSGLFLSGLAAKNPLALRAALLLGQQLDLSKLAGGPEMSPDDRESLLELVELIYRAKIKDDVLAKLKIRLALMLYGKKLKPILNEILGRLPLDQKGEKSFLQWEHLTDFTHQKLLLVGTRVLQLGGRNIENTYHLKHHPMSAEYTFGDTDFIATLTSGGESVAAAFDRVWNFTPLVIDVETAYRVAPNDFVANPEAAEAALTTCSRLPNADSRDRARVETCLQRALWSKGGKSREEREEARHAKMLAGAQAYSEEYLPARELPENWRNNPAYAIELSARDKQSLLLTYLENLHFNPRRDPGKRIYGALTGKELFWRETELAYGKGIHDLWVRGMENVCARSQEDGRERRIILNSAYFIPPANLMRAMAKMMDGTWDCRKVRVTFLTNSFETSDLSIINVFARYQLKALFDVYVRRAKAFGTYAASRSARFDYYEAVPESPKILLHTKLSILGDDVIVGSANADVRSLYMDANNAVFIRGAHDLVASYIREIDALLQDSRRTVRLGEKMAATSLDALRQEDGKLMEIILAPLAGKDKLVSELRQIAMQLQRALSDRIYRSSLILFDKKSVEGIPYDMPEAEADALRNSAQAEEELRFNRLLQLF